MKPSSSAHPVQVHDHLPIQHRHGARPGRRIGHRQRRFRSDHECPWPPRLPPWWHTRVMPVAQSRCTRTPPASIHSHSMYRLPRAHRAAPESLAGPWPGADTGVAPCATPLVSRGGVMLCVDRIVVNIVDVVDRSGRSARYHGAKDGAGRDGPRINEWGKRCRDEVTTTTAGTWDTAQGIIEICGRSGVMASTPIRRGKPSRRSGRSK